jgi:hypothetical protein
VHPLPPAASSKDTMTTAVKAALMFRNLLTVLGEKASARLIPVGYHQPNENRRKQRRACQWPLVIG